MAVLAALFGEDGSGQDCQRRVKQFLEGGQQPAEKITESDFDYRTIHVLHAVEHRPLLARLLQSHELFTEDGLESLRKSAAFHSGTSEVAAFYDGAFNSPQFCCVPCEVVCL